MRRLLPDILIEQTQELIMSCLVHFHSDFGLEIKILFFCIWKQSHKYICMLYDAFVTIHCILSWEKDVTGLLIDQSISI